MTERFALKAVICLAALALAGCDASTTGGGAEARGTVVNAGGQKLRVTTGERVSGVGRSDFHILHVTRADGPVITEKDGAAARAAYGLYCEARGGPGAGADGYFSAFGGKPAWKFGECGT